MKLNNSDLKFLLIEDNIGDLLLIEEYLKENFSNPTIYRASTFADAVGYLNKKLEIDVILLDLTLPDLSGEELVLQILKLSGHTSVIVLTGYTGEDFGVSTLSMGISDYLVKDELSASNLNKSIAYSIERKKIEKILKESNERYEILAHATSDTIWDWNIELDSMQYNDGIHRIFGYLESTFENTSKWWENKIHPDDILKVYKELNYSFEQCISHIQLEYRFLCADNTYKYIFDRAFIVYSAGKPIRIIGAMQDITERRQADLKMKQSESNLNAIFENTSEGFILVDRNGKVISYNKKAKEFNSLNLKVEIALEIGKDIIDYVEVSRQGIYQEYITKVYGGETVIYDIAYLQKDNSTIWINFLIQPVYTEGNINGFCITGRDATVQKEAEQLREFDRNNLKALINNTNDAMWSIDKNFNLITSNKSFDERIKSITGKSMSLGGSFLNSGLTESQLSRFKKHFERAFSGETFSIIEHIESPIETWSEISFHPIHKGEEIVGTASFSRNITEKIKSEKVTLELVHNLQNKNKDLQQFSYIVSHNLRSQIAKILGLTFVYKIEPDHKINEMTLLECVEQEVTNLDNVVKDMNTIISYRDLDNKQKDQVSFDTELKLIEQVLEFQIAESDATITSDFSKVSNIVSVRSYIYSIIFNLISNAIKYRRPEIPLQIHVESYQTEENICVSIQDNGMGIDLNKYGEKLFGLYKRFHSIEIEGRGIGLSLVKTQAESLGGSIEVESTVNRGTTFKVCLPINNN
ncbi:MAG: PAS domain S-box protein [Bacteroidota bacterium]|nr:PAS domain S-box protein [Bacteroidota bacterium]